ncbi:hypothetical protein M408DRAFT_287413 [Serendipita vermifera MAFF 305830]|uniref:Uncharacterized protein n=1 Tax=Serendipita vermifera MAFF 305830 TaxID=933852 RepID=A0A0C2WWQ9_SERVB|nr:hypothetical protein M408DRAFT_287413 [Serendipita vermifera MAFF 305830]
METRQPKNPTFENIFIFPRAPVVSAPNIRRTSALLFYLPLVIPGCPTPFPLWTNYAISRLLDASPFSRYCSLPLIMLFELFVCLSYHSRCSHRAISFPILLQSAGDPHKPLL